MNRGWSAVVLIAGSVLACLRTTTKAEHMTQSVASPDTTHPWRKPGDKVDSILPMEEYLRRFRLGLTEPGRLEGGEHSREALAREFLSAVSLRDTTRLTGLMISRAEFAWLVFPQHIYSRPPYELDPALHWLQIQARTQKGFTRTLNRLANHPLTFLSMHCQRDTVQLAIGRTRLWSDCRLHYRDGENEQVRRLFGSIVERNGRFKLFSLANDF
jgi:hypothetical protein